MKYSNERELAVYVLCDIFSEGAYNNLILRKALNESRLDTKQKAFATELVNGTLRNKINIDYIADSFSKTPVAKMKPLILNIIRTGIYQLVYCKRVPQSAVCNEAVRLAKAHGFAPLSGFVNGVLRSIARGLDDIKYPENRLERASIEYSCPLWMLELWAKEYGEDEAVALSKAFTSPSPLNACVNILKTSREELALLLEEEGFKTSDETILPQSLHISSTGDMVRSECFKKGLFHIMDEGAMLAVYALGAKEGSSVADVCAAPGGKSFLVGELTGNKARLFCGDIYEHKLNLIREGADRLGIKLTERLCDASGEKLCDKADFVLVDAPCSGLGLLRRKPDIKYNRAEEDIKELAALQRKILKNAVEMLSPGGILVYSTCTLTRAENEDNALFIENELGLEPVPIELPVDVEKDSRRKGRFTILPSKYNADGFFVAKFRRM